MKKIIYIFCLLFGLTLSLTVFAASKFGFVNNNIWLSNENALAGETIKIYSVIVNGDDNAVRGNLIFYDNNSPISQPLAFYLEAGGSSKVLSSSWQVTKGSHQFKAAISNITFENGLQKISSSDSSISQTETKYFDADSDGDSIPDQQEIKNGTNPDSVDTDRDGENDNLDPAPNNGNITSGPDTDGDGISDRVDNDIDNDGLANDQERILGTDIYKKDTDSDGVNDKDDFYPLDKNKWKKEEVISKNLSLVSNNTSKTINEPTADLQSIKTNEPTEEAINPNQEILKEVINSTTSSSSLPDLSLSKKDEQTAEPEVETADTKLPEDANKQGLTFINKLIILAAVFMFLGVIFYRLSNGNKRNQNIYDE